MKVGVLVRLAQDRDGEWWAGRCPSFGEVREVAGRLEDGGADSLWVADHLIYEYPDKPTVGIWECWTMLTALAVTTTRVQIGTTVLCTQFRNPAVLAKMASTLDEVSGGRLILGLGAGWNRPEFDAFGIPFDHRVDRFEEALRIIVPLLREGQVDFEGRYYSARKCQLAPRTPRPAVRRSWSAPRGRGCWRSRPGTPTCGTLATAAMPPPSSRCGRHSGRPRLKSVARH